MTPAQREARMRAVRRMQDDIYEGIGGNRLYGSGGEDGVEREPPSRSSASAQARDVARSMTREGTQPLRDALAEDNEERDEMRSKKRKLAGY